MTEMLVEGRDVVVRYGPTVALARSDFSIPRTGGVTALIGPNGSGKSTLLNVIAGLHSPSAGSVRVMGGPAEDTRRRMAYVLQSMPVSTMAPITVREVVGMGRYPQVGFWRPFRRQDREAVEGAMERMQITDLAHRHLHELSGGQRQRVYVAQAICQPHEVLLLDEPLTGLDIVSARTIDDLLHGDRDDGCDIILTTHDLAEARAADHVILVSGKVLASGPPSQVCTRRLLEEAFGLGALHEGGEFLDEHVHEKS